VLVSAGVKLGDHDPMNANLYVGTSSLFAASLGKEMPFLEPFYVKNDHFTKTGLGQT
jgi:hypothetical protein